MKKKLLLFAVAACFGSLGIAACTTDGPQGGGSQDGEPHKHSWSSWTVAENEKPSATAEGKATRACSGAGECDATEADTQIILPVLDSADYTKSADSATCSAAGSITYTYNKNGVSVGFEVATEINANAHNYGGYEYTDGTGHYKVCGYNASHKTEKEAHNADGNDGECSVCGYKAPPELPECDEHDWQVTERVYSEIEKTPSKQGRVDVSCKACGEKNGATRDYAQKITSSGSELAEFGNYVRVRNVDGTFEVKFRVAHAGSHVFKLDDICEAYLSFKTVKIGNDTVYADGTADNSAYDSASISLDTAGNWIFAVNLTADDVSKDVSITVAADEEYKGSEIYAIVSVDAPSLQTVALAVGDNDVVINEANLTVDSTLLHYTFTPLKAGWYTFYLPNGLNASKYDKAANTSTQWIETGGEDDYGVVELGAGEKLTVIFIGNEEKTFTVKIEEGKKEINTTLALGEPITAKYGDVASSVTFTVGADIPEAEYYVELNPSMIYTRSQIKVTINGKDYTFAAGAGESQAFDFKRKVTLKGGDKITVMPAISLNGKIMITLKPVIAADKLGLGPDGSYTHTFGNGEFESSVQLADSVTSGYYKINVSLDGLVIKQGTASDGSTNYYYEDGSGEPVNLIVKIVGLNGNQCRDFALKSDGTLEFALSFDFANRDTSELGIGLQAGEYGSYVEGITAVYTLTEAEKGDSDPELPSATVLGIGETGAVTAKAGETETSVKLAPGVSGGYYTLNIAALSGIIPETATFTLRGFNATDIVVKGNNGSAVSVTVKFVIENNAIGDYGIYCSENASGYKFTLTRTTVAGGTLGVGDDGSLTVTVNADYGVNEFAPELSDEVTSRIYEVTVTAVDGTLSADDVITLTGFAKNDIVLTGATDNTVTAIVRFSLSNAKPKIIADLNGVTLKVTLKESDEKIAETFKFELTAAGTFEADTKLIDESLVTVTNTVEMTATTGSASGYVGTRVKNKTPFAMAGKSTGANVDVLKFELQEGYTYTVTVVSGTGAGNSKTTTITLHNGLTDDGAYSVEQTSGTSKANADCLWDNLSAGTYYLQQSVMTGIISITVVATPI